MKVTVNGPGVSFTVECEAGDDCSKLRKVVKDLYDRSLDNYKLYSGSDRTLLNDTDEVPSEVLAVKSKNESAL